MTIHAAAKATTERVHIMIINTRRVIRKTCQKKQKSLLSFSFTMAIHFKFLKHAYCNQHSFNSHPLIA